MMAGNNKKRLRKVVRKTQILKRKISLLKAEIKKMFEEKLTEPVDTVVHDLW